MAEAPRSDAEDDWYFKEYGRVATHREMLEDEVRVRSFRKAIFATCRGKAVLDIGCGSGVLSLFAAQAGASRVVAVEGSARAARLAKEAVRSNGFEGRITVVCGRIEDEAVAAEVDAALQRWPGRSEPSADGRPPKVDVIVSEWMGYMLVFEDMFRSVGVARDRWLSPDGVMIPAICSVWAAPFCGQDLIEELGGFWQRKPYGFDMSHMVESAVKEVCSQPVIDELEPGCLLAKPAKLWRLDCAKDPAEAARTQHVAFDFVLERAMPLHGLAVWFTCLLAPGIGFSTGPGSDSTHWAQTLLFAGRFGEDDTGSSQMVYRTKGLRCGRGDSVQGELCWDTTGRSMRVLLRGTRSSCAGEVSEAPDAPQEAELPSEDSVPFTADFDWSLSMRS